MAIYQIRAATIDDIDALVDHRVGMFTDMGLAIQLDKVAVAYRSWLADTMPAGVYRGWVVETGSAPLTPHTRSPTTDGDRGRSSSIVAGGGIIILPWPPGPQSLTGQMAFVFNIYTAPPHRRRGIGRLVMEAIHSWCRQHGIDCVRLNASPAGRPLYASMGYVEISSTTLEILLDEVVDDADR
jgi:GNAT superfamily N-acetyltransferase